MTELVRYNAALNAIAEARAVDELLTIRDSADALRAAARVANNKQAEIDMAEIRFRAERRVGEMMAMQRHAGLLADGGDAAKARVATKPEVRATLSEAGIDKNLADRARKLAAIPKQEFDSIVGDWRERVEAEGERVTVKLLRAGDSAQQGRHENDFYPTPGSVIAEIALRWKPNAKAIWEPCAGDGRVADALRNVGHTVIVGDIAQGDDFFERKSLPQAGIALCTNPPFGRVRQFIDHAFALGVREMCLVLAERLWASGAGREQFERHRPTMWANMDWREDYLGKGGSPDRALAVAIWENPCAPRCDFDVWSRQAEAEGETFDPETGEITEQAPPVDAPPAFEQIREGLTEALAVAKGEAEPYRVHTPEPPTAADNARKIRPYCLHADNLNKCGGMGRVHCHACLKAHADAEGETA